MTEEKSRKPGQGFDPKSPPFNVCHFLKEDRPFLPIEEYVRGSKAINLYKNWLQSNLEAIETQRQMDQLAKENAEEPSELASESHLIDKNVVRKRILDRLGNRLSKYDGVKDKGYYFSNIYDPLDSRV